MSGSVVVLTGAGISAESGIRTFRASDGLWESHRIEDVATWDGFCRDPALVYRFYNDRRRTLSTVEPNVAHVALAEFETRYDGDFLLVTQNVDDLHERAGSQNLLHMHGSLLTMRCLACEKKSAITGELSSTSRCPVCQTTGRLRPDIVWFGEMPYAMNQIERALAQCTLFVSIGTSGQVYPAAGFVQIAATANARCVELNLETSSTSPFFHQHIHQKATAAVPAFFAIVR